MRRLSRILTKPIIGFRLIYETFLMLIIRLISDRIRIKKGITALTGNSRRGVHMVDIWLLPLIWLRPLLDMAINITGLVIGIINLLGLRKFLFNIYLLKCLVKTVFFRNWENVVYGFQD